MAFSSRNIFYLVRRVAPLVASRALPRSMRRWITPAILVCGVLYALFTSATGPNAPDWLGGRDSASEHDVAFEDDIVRLYEAKRSGDVVESSGIIERVLDDDEQGSRHQRLVVRVASAHTVMVAHNIDLAPRVASVAVGDRIDFRGQYEWNERGGVIHWTHHDPDGRRPGGWLKHAGETYR